jgi:signal transduction histidine kinase
VAAAEQKKGEKSCMLEEVIDGTPYKFDTTDCITMFERLRNVYGNDFRELVGQEQQFISDPFWNRATPSEQEIREIDSLILNALQDIKSQIGINQEVRLLYDSGKRDPIFVEADKHRITQVISNLLSNAINFTKRGTIAITKEKKEAGSVNISVEDKGTGIDPEIFPRLFTKFVTKSDKGIGLGLYISKRIVEAHGGRIWAENNTGRKGAIFTFSLPMNN